MPSTAQRATEAARRGLRNLQVITRDTNVPVGALRHPGKGHSDRMARHFFTGGMMPSDDLAARCQHHLRLVDRWSWNGRRCARTAEAWLRRMDAAETTLAPHEGRQWYVAHHLLERRGTVAG